MREPGVVGSVYGYLICVIAILLFIRSGAGFVNSAFALAGVPTAWHPYHGAAMGMASHFGAGAGRGHLFALRGLVVNALLLTIAVLLFRWHWRWLQQPPPVA
jgi:hypothetical protein